MQLHCSVCDLQWPLQTPLQYVCTQCHGNLEVLYDYDSIRASWSRESLQGKPFDLWRYLPLYPVKQAIQGPPVGGTPCFQAPRLAKQWGVREVWVKNDGMNPSASFKDRASAVALQWAKENDYPTIAAASTGNAGAAAAFWAAVLEMPTYIFLPETAPPAKVAQLMACGVNVLMVRGTYDQAFDLCAEASQKFGWFNRNTGTNPITREGKKSVSFEIAEQMQWDPPDVIVVSVGDGNIISGVGKGFDELLKLGWITKRPKLLAVQAEGSAAVTHAWREGRAIQPVSSDTIADSISVDLPRDGEAAVRAIRNSDGWAVTVTDEAILQAIPELAQKGGVLAEPAASAVCAGMHEAHKAGQLQSDWRVLLLVTGHGLKDIGAMQKSVGPPPSIAPSMEALESFLDNSHNLKQE